MRMTKLQVESLVRRVVLGLESKKLVQFNKGKDQILHKAKEIIESDYAKEAQLDEEVNKRLDQLEREQTADFQRYKMFSMLKKKMAEEQGIIL